VCGWINHQASEANIISSLSFFGDADLGIYFNYSSGGSDTWKPTYGGGGATEVSIGNMTGHELSYNAWYFCAITQDYVSDSEVYISAYVSKSGTDSVSLDALGATALVNQGSMQLMNTYSYKYTTVDTSFGAVGFNHSNAIVDELYVFNEAKTKKQLQAIMQMSVGKNIPVPTKIGYEAVILDTGLTSVHRQWLSPETSTPELTSEGMTWYSATDKDIRLYDGDAWRSIGAWSNYYIPTALTLETTITIEADTESKVVESRIYKTNRTPYTDYTISYEAANENFYIVLDGALTDEALIQYRLIQLEEETDGTYR
jgi:hypothetical protein